ncbi:outer membrane protein assembly factor BamD [Ichthyenterobacterium sp. W332]|uniref:Outer membrane protein assembly factor BamD n=1 Tax=Microcosmobacter mediterraneus TaxID=3075607 RepID=A0ABU2YHC3_9FLAO|nr:outer membrane protein assembly factor BamD [Ichthyenterobacterium sp. W332]MDT0557536.1 outer membrane protein assembly factor BamD [Ichthyenterobacterium sp. W332]
MKKLIAIFSVLLVLSSCSEFQKALKSEDIKTKFDLGIKLYEEGKFNKANRLFAQIVPNYRGKPQAEKLMFMYSNTFYMMRDYHISGYQFDRFTNAYANSEKVEEAAFLAAKSYYMLSPVHSKEQKETYEAIDKLQLFINKYPESDKLAECNAMVKELNAKLERKAFEIAKQYNITARVAIDYEACIKSMDNLLLEYPGTAFREDALFWKLDSEFKLATNSIERKKADRTEKGIEFYNAFKKIAQKPELIEAADKMYAELIEIKSLNDIKS